MIQGFEELQKLSKDNLDAAVKAFGSQQKGVQAIATEVADFSKKQLEASSAAFEKLAGVKTIDKAIEVQSDFAKSSYEAYVAHATKVSEMVTELAKEAFKPIEGIMSKVKAS